ncbi:MAG: 4Fe-4S binding protein [Chloroflexi bacterium]|nr:4Fe-4S binding protein [Chloroflexota bacterium]
MLSRQVVDKLIAATHPQSVRVNATACLNAKHKDRHCDKCLACPTDAVHLSGAQVEVDETRCVDCGLCAAVCPTGVFTTSGAGDTAILSSAKSFANLELACQRRQPREATRAPKVEGVVALNCLARLSPELLTALGAEHASVWLDDSPCADCPIGARTHPEILAARAAANRLLAVWNRRPVDCYVESADKLTKEARRVSRLTEGDQTASRRELFASLSRRATEAAATAFATMIPETPNGTVKGADTNNSSSPRQTFLRALSSLGTPPAEHVEGEHLATIRIAKSCTACGLCAKICPTQALRFRTEGTSFTLSLNTRKCLAAACHLCELICAPHALTLTMGVTREASTADDLVLRSGALSVCRKCSALFAAQAGESLCSICRDAETKRSALVDDLFKNF